MAAADFWSNRERAQSDVEEVSRVRGLINPFRELERQTEHRTMEELNMRLAKEAIKVPDSQLTCRGT